MGKTHRGPTIIGPISAIYYSPDGENWQPIGGIVHADDGTGWCQRCGCAYPCPWSDGRVWWIQPDSGLTRPPLMLGR